MRTRTVEVTQELKFNKQTVYLTRNSLNLELIVIDCPGRMGLTKTELSRLVSEANKLFEEVL